jgi:hypothetical protein
MLPPSSGLKLNLIIVFHKSTAYLTEIIFGFPERADLFLYSRLWLSARLTYYESKELPVVK